MKKKAIVFGKTEGRAPVWESPALAPESSAPSSSSPSSAEAWGGEHGEALVGAARDYLKQNWHEGANPGLCVVRDDSVPPALVEIARRAQREVLRLDEFDDDVRGMKLALSSWGETGQGRIGAASGAALRSTGADGRFIGLRGIRDLTGRASVGEICARSGVEEVRLEGGGALGPRTLQTREALLLAFFATFVVIVRAAMRWHLHIPGHSMLTTALLLVLARACVERAAAATIVGTLAGLACTALGMGSDGLLIALKLALPGMAVDIGWKPFPIRLHHLLRGALLGACAGATHFLPVLIAEGLAGLDAAVVMAHALLAAGSKAAFGAAGGAIVERLRHHGVIAPF